MFKYFITIFTLITSVFSFGVIESDFDYYKIEDSDHTYIFTQEYETLANELMGYMNIINKEYQNSFGFKLSKKNSIILASSNNQIANATSTVVPNHIMTNYGDGGGAIDYFNSPNWLLTLSLHESAHQYQLDAKKQPSKILQNIFGNNSFPFFVPFPIFTLPNTLLPTFILEGNSVYNESRFNIGGRLYGGRHRALFLTLLKSNQLSYKKLLNDHDNFPFQEENYIIGGYFFAYLARIYGEENVNKIFINHATHYINPLRINDTFYTTFGKNLEDLIFDFLTFYKPMAQNFTTTNGQTLLFSKKYQSFGENSDEILILTSDLKNKTEISIFNKKTKKISSKETNLLFGKPFLINNEFYTSTSSIIENKKIIYSLFNEDRVSNKKYENKIVQDLKGNNEISFDSKTAFKSPELYLNDRFYANINSSSFLDQNGNIYYFKQIKDKRVLYINKKPIYYFKGFDGKIVDISDEIYFIAPTIYGSGLYKINQNGVFRLGNSDDILDAKHIQNNQFLVETVTKSGYEYKITALEAKKEQPVFWYYPFNDKKNIFATEILLSQTKTQEGTKYNHLNNAQFNSLYPSISFDDSGDYLLSLSSNFSDPLNFNTLNLSLAQQKTTDLNNSQNLKSILIANYENRRYLLNFGINLGAIKDDNAPITDRNYIFNTYLNYPLYRDSQNYLQFSLIHYHDLDDKTYEPFISMLSYNHNKSHPLLMEPNRNFYTNIYSRNTDKEFSQGVDIGGGFYLKDLYLFGGSKFSNSNEASIKIKNLDITSNDITNFYLLDLWFEAYASRAYNAFIGGKYTIDANFYNTIIPLSLRKMQLFGKYEYLDFYNKDYKQTNWNIDELSYGADFELLFLHKYIIRSKITYVENSKAPQDEKGKIIFTINSNF